VSFDVFLQRFRNGGSAEADRELLSKFLRPYLVDSGHGFHDLRFGDGHAALFGYEDLGSGFMVNHLSGKEAWNFLVQVAMEASLTILATGCPAVVPRRDLIEHLPDELGEAAVVIDCGADLLRLVESS
jgi:hypothetical protein